MGRDGGSLLTTGGDDQVIFDGGNRRTAIRNEWTKPFPNAPGCHHDKRLLDALVSRDRRPVGEESRG
jgi:hypothetical protein